MGNVLIALGGNALGDTPEEQLQLVQRAAITVVDLIEQGHEVVIAHGNGPQVGKINMAFEIASKLNSSIPAMPLPESGAMSQGYIGYHLQNAISEELKNRTINKNVATVVTQVTVDPEDTAFEHPTKPIGAFYSVEEANRLMKETGQSYIEDSGRGYRRVIPSPKPNRVVEKDAVQCLINAGQVVITVGGGGIPVIEDGTKLKGVEAVIDKDLASECLAEELGVDYLFILTAVERVAINFGKPNQVDLENVSVEYAKQLIEDGQFAPGSMLPKVQAAVKFVESAPNRKAIISSLEKANEAMMGNTGTTFYSPIIQK